MGPTRMILTSPSSRDRRYAVAGGMELACGATFGHGRRRHVRRLLSTMGVPLIDGGTFGSAIIGAGRALDLILTGRASARRGLAMGLVNRVVERATSEPRPGLGRADRLVSRRLHARRWLSMYEGIGRPETEAMESSSPTA